MILTDNELKVVKTLPLINDGEWVFFDNLSEETGLSMNRLKGILCSLIKKNIVDYEDKPFLEFSYRFVNPIAEKIDPEYNMPIEQINDYWYKHYEELIYESEIE